MRKVKVLLVDDSALIRQTIKTLFEDDDKISIVGTAPNPITASKMINELKPDVLLLDVVMPKLNGLSFLKNIMLKNPMPVIIFSSYVEEGSVNAFKAFEYGAVDIIEKPKLKTAVEISKYKFTLHEALKAASIANISNIANNIGKNLTKVPEIRIRDHKTPPFYNQKPKYIIAIGASTGGTEAIRLILQDIPEDSPPIVITQHMPVGFTHSFANRLDKLSKITVKEAEDFEPLKNGHAYIARGDRHLTIKDQKGSYVLHLEDSEPVNRHKPSVDVLFNSVAKTFKSKAVGVILTGMGSDGAKGLGVMKQSGAYTIAQDEKTCVVFGMPRAAILLGITDNVLPLYQITESLIEKYKKSGHY